MSMTSSDAISPLERGRLRVELSVVSRELDPDKLRGMVGIEPVSSWRKGTLRTATSRSRHRSHGVRLASGLPEEATVDEHAAALDAALSPAAAVIRAETAAGRVEVRVWVWCMFPTGHVGFSISKPTLDLLDHLGARLEFEAYL
jgi:Domain of unknown function (DUF4279)